MGAIKNRLKSLYLSGRYETLINYINAYHPRFSYQITGDRPSIRFNGKIFVGFPNASSDVRVFRVIANRLPKDLTVEYYRVLRDVITRYIYPHMMPLLKPLTRGYKTMSGFHGQHKDTIPDIDDVVLRDRLTDLFMFRHDDIIMNCGAYAGYGDLRVSEYLPNGKIIAIEAKKECYDLLKENIGKNAVGNILALNHAVWNKNETIDLNTGELQANTLVSDVSFFDPTGRNNPSREIIEAVTLDSLADRLSLKKLDFISLTLNGAEVEVIDGMKEVLSNFAPRIRLAGWYWRGKEPVWKLCSEKLKKHNYEVVVGKYKSVYAFKST